MKLLNFLSNLLVVTLCSFSMFCVISSTILLLALYDVIDVDDHCKGTEEIVEARTVEHISTGDIPLEIMEPPAVEIETVTYFDIPLDQDLQKFIFDLCEEKGVDAAIVIAVIERESRYRDYVVGDNGRSFGLMQIQERWHRERMNELGCDNLLDPYQNVKVGIDYLAELTGRGRGIEWVLMAYNGGPSYANRQSEKGVVSEYAREVLEESAGLVRQ